MTATSLRSTRVLLPARGEQPARIVAARIVIRDGRIAQVDEDDQRADEDFGDRLITPAFVNAHTHLAMAFARGLEVPDAAKGNRVEDLFFELERRLTPAMVGAFARMGAYESLLAGVGFVWEHYYHAPSIVRAMWETGLCGAVAPTLQDLSGPGVGGAERALAYTQALDANPEALRNGTVAALGPHATDTVSSELWKEILELGARSDLPIHLHLAQSVEELSRAEAQGHAGTVARLQAVGALDHAPGLVLAHGIFLGDAELQRLASAGHCLVWCPRSASFFAFPADPRRWEEAGVKWVIASDAAASNDAMDPRLELFEAHRLATSTITESRSYASFARAPSLASARSVWAERAQQWRSSRAWANPRALSSRVWSRPGALHPKLLAGVVEAGALANLIVWDLDGPAAWPAQDPLHSLCFSVPGGGAAIYNLMTLGQWRGESGNFRRSVLDSKAYAQARTEASARRRELLASR